MLDLGVVFQVFGAFFIAFCIVFAWFLKIHGNPIKQISIDTNNKVNEMHKKIVV